jgi:hypothetical protein
VYVGGKCVIACPRGTKRIGSTSKCEDDQEIGCNDGEIKNGDKGCVSSSPSILSGLLSNIGGQLAPSLFAGLNSAAQEVVGGQLQQAAGAYANLGEGVRNYTRNILATNLSVEIPSQPEIDTLISNELAKPITRTRNSFDLWGVL